MQLVRLAVGGRCILLGVREHQMHHAGGCMVIVCAPRSKTGSAALHNGNVARTIHPFKTQPPPHLWWRLPPPRAPPGCC